MSRPRRKQRLTTSSTLCVKSSSTLWVKVKESRLGESPFGLGSRKKLTSAQKNLFKNTKKHTWTGGPFWLALLVRTFVRTLTLGPCTSSDRIVRSSHRIVGPRDSGEKRRPGGHASDTRRWVSGVRCRVGGDHCEYTLSASDVANTGNRSRRVLDWTPRTSGMT